MKRKTSIFKRCGWCKIIKRKKYLYIYCKKVKKHKQKQI